MKRLVALIAAVGTLFCVRAQTPAVTARLEPDSIGIGDRFDLVIEVDKDLVQVVEFPAFQSRTVADGQLELVESMPVDTLSREGRRLKLLKRYRLAAFEEGRFHLGGAQVLYIDKNIVDTLDAGDSLLLEVGTFRIDSTSHAIYDLKAQKTLPFRLAEIRTYLLAALAVLALLAGALYGVWRYLRRRGKGFAFFRPEPELPPHVVAIKALEALHHQKLWQNNRHKQYYSGLTDILRTYIAARWEISAMEMTSDEIIAAMRGVDLPDKARMDLSAVLRDADLVKFAKATPEADENESDYLKCYYFVEETKLVAEEPAISEDECLNLKN